MSDANNKKNTYFSQENGVYVLLEPDYPSESYDEAVFYDEDNEKDYEGFFEFNDEKESDKVIKKTYPN